MEPQDRSRSNNNFEKNVILHTIIIETQNHSERTRKPVVTLVKFGPNSKMDEDCPNDEILETIVS